MNFSYFSGKCVVDASKLPIINTTKPIYSLGTHTDIFGDRWNVNCRVGELVYACREGDMHPYYTKTTGAAFDSISQTWHAHLNHVVVVK